MKYDSELRQIFIFILILEHNIDICSVRYACQVA